MSPSCFLRKMKNVTMTYVMVQSLDAVEYVAENGVIRVSSLEEVQVASQDASKPTSSIPWNLDRIDQTELPLDGQYNPPNAGKGVLVYVVDSGILPSHSEFGQRARVCFDAVGGDGIDCTGHGTHVAGVVAGATYGVASRAHVCGVRVVGADCDTDGTVTDVVAGLDWIAHHASTDHAGKPAVATLSLNMNGEHVPLGHALDGLIAETGITVVVAAGNMNVDACNSSPSCNEQVITVGATTIEDTRWASSNWGSCVDIFAPGDEVESATCTGPKDTSFLSGTSEACPHVAGAAAILLSEDPSLSHASVKAKIVASATPNVLLFNQANCTDVIEATANLMLRVGTDKPSAIDKPVEPEQNDIHAEVPIPKIADPNVFSSE